MYWYSSTWEVSNTGLIFGLKKEIPDLIKQHITKFALNLMPEEIDASECAWPIHPGGKGILQGATEALNLTQEQVSASWSVLQKYGNTSSASFLFVLQELLLLKPTNKYAVGLGFGPGLCFEGMLLEIT